MGCELMRWLCGQSLTENQLRERVLLRVDGGMRNGRDVMLVAALGGDEYGFGTVAMIATGCIMARVCHTNNCPVGVASQREELRARFPGAPADLVYPLVLYIPRDAPASSCLLWYCVLDGCRGAPRAAHYACQLNHGYSQSICTSSTCWMTCGQCRASSAACMQ